MRTRKTAVLWEAEASREKKRWIKQGQKKKTLKKTLNHSLSRLLIREREKENREEKRKREDNAQRPKKWSEGKKGGANEEEEEELEEEELEEESTGSRAKRTNFYTFADPLAVPLATGAPGPANSLPAFPFWLVFAAAAFSLVSTWA